MEWAMEPYEADAVREVYRRGYLAGLARAAEIADEVNAVGARVTRLHFDTEIEREEKGK